MSSLSKKQEKLKMYNLVCYLACIKLIYKPKRSEREREKKSICNKARALQTRVGLDSNICIYI
jgi:hypothetical protein